MSKLPNLIVFAGNSHPELAKRVAHQLRIDLGAADVALSADAIARLDGLVNQRNVSGARYAAQSQTEVDTEEF